MQQTGKAKVVNSLQENLKCKDASDDSSDMNESEHSDKLFDFFLCKASNNTCRDSPTKISESFVDRKRQR